MIVKEKIPSRETCAEAGWFAWDFILEKPLEDAAIFSLRPLGSFVYLSMLSRPFFKIEMPYALIKGLRGDSHIRVAVHNEHREILADVERFLSRLPG